MKLRIFSIIIILMLAFGASTSLASPQVPANLNALIGVWEDTQDTFIYYYRWEYPGTVCFKYRIRLVRGDMPPNYQINIFQWDAWTQNYIPAQIYTNVSIGTTIAEQSFRPQLTLYEGPLLWIYSTDVAKSTLSTFCDNFTRTVMYFPLVFHSANSTLMESSSQLPLKGKIIAPLIDPIKMKPTPTPMANPYP